MAKWQRVCLGPLKPWVLSPVPQDSRSEKMHTKTLFAVSFQLVSCLKRAEGACLSWQDLTVQATAMTSDLLKGGAALGRALFTGEANSVL